MKKWEISNNYGLLQNVKKMRLKNGLQVITKEDFSSPLVAVFLTYNVGSKDEKPGLTGVSHFIEHMMFKGSKNFRPGEIDRITQEYGGYNNAMTSPDFTTYFFSFVSDGWKKALEIESDRMVNCLFDPLEFQRERRVIIEESLMYRNYPVNTLYEKVHQKAFLENPYRNPVIGQLGDLQNLEYKDLFEFYRQKYVPSNALMVVAGNALHTEIMETAEKYFGTLPSGNVKETKFPQEPDQNRERCVTIKKDVQIPIIHLAYKAPRAFSDDFPALTLLSFIFSEGKSSVLSKMLIEEKQSASSLFTQYRASYLDSLFDVVISIHPEIDYREVIRAFDDTVRTLAVDLKDSIVEKAKHQMEADFVKSHERIEDQAAMLGEWELLGGIENIPDFINQLKSLTARDIRAVIRKYFKKKNRVRGVLLPEKASHRKTVRKKGPFRGIVSYPADSVTLDSQKKIQVKNETPVSFNNFRKFKILKPDQFTLDNGLKVVTLHRPALPLITLKLLMNFGSVLEPDDKSGLAYMTARMLKEGTINRNAMETAEALERVGADLSARSGALTTQISLESLSKDFELGIEIILDILQNPVFDEDELIHEKQLVTDSIKGKLDSPKHVASSWFRRLIYRGHPLSRAVEGEIQTVEGLTKSDLIEFHSTFYRPDNAFLVIVGNLDKGKEYINLLKKLESWTASGVTAAPPPEVRTERNSSIKCIEMDKEQLNIFMGHLGIKRNSPYYTPLFLMDNILGWSSGLTDRINSRLRETEGLAYDVYSHITVTASKAPGVFQAFIGTSPENASVAIKGIKEEIRNIRRNPVNNDELTRVKNYKLGTYLTNFETNGDVANYLLDVLYYNRSWDYRIQFVERMKSVTPEEIQEAAQICLDEDNHVIVMAGPIPPEFKNEVHRDINLDI